MPARLLVTTISLYLVYMLVDTRLTPQPVIAINSQQHIGRESVAYGWTGGGICVFLIIVLLES